MIFLNHFLLIENGIYLNFLQRLMDNFLGNHLLRQADSNNFAQLCITIFIINKVLGN
jgi:hypothetical protein